MKAMQKQIEELKHRVSKLETIVHEAAKRDSPNYERTDDSKNGDHRTNDNINQEINKGLSHCDILKQEHKSLVDNLDPSCELLDHLVSTGALDVSDSVQISRIQKRKSKTRFLLTRLHRYSPDRFLKFVTSLHVTNPDLARTLKKLCEHHLHVQGDVHAVQCIQCLIRKRVDIGDIIDVLFQHSVIGLEQLQKHSACEIEDSKLWNYIFFIINSWKSYENPINILIDALGDSKYPDIVDKLNFLSKTDRDMICTKKMNDETTRVSANTRYRNGVSSTDTCSEDTYDDSGNFRRVRSFFFPKQEKFRPKFSSWEDPPENIESKIRRAKTFNVSYFSQRRKTSKPVKRVKRENAVAAKESERDTEEKLSDSTDPPRPKSTEKFV